MIWWTGAVIVIGVLGAIRDFRRNHEVERVLMMVAWAAIILVGVLGIANDLGYIRNGISYSVTTLSLFLLFAALVYQVQQHKKGRF
jgi:hypothetical protein